MIELDTAVRGEAELVSTLRAAARAVDSLDHARAAAELGPAAAARAPVRTRALARSVAVTATAAGPVLTAGGPGVDYAAPVHARDPFLTDTITAHTAELLDAYTDQLAGVVDTIRGA